MAMPGPCLRIQPQLLVMLAMLTCFAGKAGDQTLSPTSQSFGNWVLQTTSTAKTVVLTNSQTIPLTITAISISGDFAQTSNCPLSPNALAAKLSCTLAITFTPTVLGTRTGTLTVSDDVANSPQTAKLSGNVGRAS